MFPRCSPATPNATKRRSAKQCLTGLTSIDAFSEKQRQVSTPAHGWILSGWMIVNVTPENSVMTSGLHVKKKVCGAKLSAGNCSSISWPLHSVYALSLLMSD